MTERPILGVSPSSSIATAATNIPVLDDEMGPHPSNSAQFQSIRSDVSTPSRSGAESSRGDGDGLSHRHQQNEALASVSESFDGQGPIGGGGSPPRSPSQPTQVRIVDPRGDAAAGGPTANGTRVGGTAGHPYLNTRTVSGKAVDGISVQEHWEEQWLLWEGYITPYEADRATYRTARYSKPLYVVMSTVLLDHLIRTGGVAGTLDGLLLLGFAPQNPADVRISTTASVAPVAPLPSMNSNSTALNSTSNVLSSLNTSTSSTPCAPPPAIAVSTPPPAGGGGVGSVGSVTPAPELSTGSPHSFLQGTGEHSPTPSGGLAGINSNNSSVVHVAVPSSTRTGIKLRMVVTDTKQVSFNDSVEGFTGGNDVLSNHSGGGGGGGGGPGGVDTRVRDLEAEVRDLTRQLRLLKSRDGGSGGGGGFLSPAGGSYGGTVPSFTDSQVSPPRESPPNASPPVPIITNTKPLVATTAGNGVVCLNVNYLDPDAAPYVVSIAGLADRQLIPCNVLDHKFIIFVAPPHPAGSVSVSILGTQPNGHLRRYAKAVWMEYRAPDAYNTLSYHAVNQLATDIPLPSSTTGPDPSEYNTEGKSEADMTEQTEIDQDGLVSDNVSVATVEEHPKLTREMLEMLQGGRAVTFAQGGTSSPVLSRGHTTTRRTRTSVANSECGSEAVSSSYMQASAMAPSVSAIEPSASVVSDGGDNRSELRSNAD